MSKQTQAIAEDIHGITWALFVDGTYGSRFGSAAPWRDADPESIPESIVSHLADGGDGNPDNGE